MFNVWTIPARKEQRDRLDRTHRRQLRSVLGHYFKEDEPLVTCQEIYQKTDSIPVSVEIAERRWSLLGHILRLESETPANKAMVQYFKKTIGGTKRTIYAGATKTSTMTMLRDEYRIYTNPKMKSVVGTSQFTHGIDLDKFRVIAQDGMKWAALVNHITNMMRVVWIRKNCTRKRQEMPWNNTPVIRVRAADTEIPRRAQIPRDMPRLLVFDETTSSEGTIHT